MIVDFLPCLSSMKLHKVKQLLSVKYLHSEVIDDKQVKCSHLSKNRGSLGFYSCHMHILQEFLHIGLSDLVSGEAGLISQSGSDEAFPDSGRACHKNRCALFYVFAVASDRIWFLSLP